MKRLAPALLVLLVAVFSRSAFAADDVWPLLRKPGHIILLRHSNAPGSLPESNDMDLSNCAIQRNLDDAGKAQAARIGEAFRSHGVKTVQLVSSQYCRAMETSRLLKLGPVTQLPALNQTVLSDPAGMRDAGEKILAFMKTIPARRLTMLVSHVTNIQSVAGVQLDSGEFAIVHFDPKGQVIIDGRVAVP